VLIGIIIAVVGVGLIALGILAINAVLRQSFTPQPQATPVVEATTNIIITTHDMANGTVINREDIQLATVPVSLVPRDALDSIESALGKYVTTHLIQGEMVLQHHLADPTNISHDVGYIISEDQVLMAFPSTDLLSGLGVLQRGDTVDIFASMTVEVTPTVITTVPGTGTEEQQAITRLFTFDAFQQIQVTAVVAEVITDEQGQTHQGRVLAYLFALAPQDALVLKHMRDTGAIFDFVLRSPTSTELFEVSPVTIDYLIQLFELRIPR
jgi:pilus assembly protein CpaB